MLLSDPTLAVGNTPLVKVAALSPADYEIYVKLEGNNPTGSIKDRVALYLLTDAERRGEIAQGSRIIEPTSGNTGIALAALCVARGYKLTCVMPENTSEERRTILELYGADIVFSPAGEGSNGAVRLAREIADGDDDVYMPFQYGNESNPRAHYETTAPEIIADLPDLAAVVSGLGTGGTLAGVGRRLKEHDPDIKVFAAEPEYGDLVYGLRNLDEGFVPPIFDPTLLDGRIKVDSQRSLEATRALAQHAGIFGGVSTGAALSVAQRMCSPDRLPEGSKVVVISADGGWKYLSTGAFGAGDPTTLAEGLADTVWA
ncbi:MAG TPA: cysteine synthase family protein [Euzebyales bacterium]|nr:cysteine synthase family protein [Euzebyales bacterium]